MRRIRKMKITTVQFEDSSFEGKWSGAMSVPAPGDVVGVPFGGSRAAAHCSGYFVTSGEKEPFLGVNLDLLELPADLEKYGIGSAILTQIAEGGVPLWQNTRFNNLALFGTEICEVRKPAEWFEECGLGADEEFAALVAVVLGGRSWKWALSAVWSNGAWSQSPYLELCGSLQRIRNTGHMEFVDYALKKNRKFVERARTAIKRAQEACRSGRKSLR